MEIRVKASGQVYTLTHQESLHTPSSDRQCKKLKVRVNGQIYNFGLTNNKQEGLQQAPLVFRVQNQNLYIGQKKTNAATAEDNTQPSYAKEYVNDNYYSYVGASSYDEEKTENRTYSSYIRTITSITKREIIYEDKYASGYRVTTYSSSDDRYTTKQTTYTNSVSADISRYSTSLTHSVYVNTSAPTKLWLAMDSAIVENNDKPSVVVVGMGSGTKTGYVHRVRTSQTYQNFYYNNLVQYAANGQEYSYSNYNKETKTTTSTIYYRGSASSASVGYYGSNQESGIPSTGKSTSHNTYSYTSVKYMLTIPAGYQVGTVAKTWQSISERTYYKNHVSYTGSNVTSTRTYATQGTFLTANVQPSNTSYKSWINTYAEKTLYTNNKTASAVTLYSTNHEYYTTSGQYEYLSNAYVTKSYYTSTNCTADVFYSTYYTRNEEVVDNFEPQS